MLKTDGRGSIRKVKGGAVGILSLSTLLVGVSSLVNTGVAGADELPVAGQPNVGLTNQQDGKQGTVEAVNTPKQVAPTSSETALVTKDVSKDAPREVPKEVPKDTNTETYREVKSADFDKAKEEAVQNGVSVTKESKPAIKDSDQAAQEDLNKQTNDLKDATKAQIASDAIAALDKEKLTDAGIHVVDGKTKQFTNLKDMEAFVKQQSKAIASDIETKHAIDKEAQLATDEFKRAGVNVVVGPSVIKSSPQEALDALKALQAQAASAVKTKQELDSAFLALRERAKTAGLLVKDGKTVTLASAKDARDFLDKQAKDTDALIKRLKVENGKLDTAILMATTHGIKVTKGSNLTVSSVEDATKRITSQIDDLNALIKAVDDSKSLIASTTNTAKQVGVVLDGETVVTATDGNARVLKEQVTSALRDLQIAAAAQSSAKARLDKLVADAKAKGLSVTVSGSRKVSADRVSSELAAITDKITSALAAKEKAEAAYATALENAQKASRLSKDSTATKTGDLYKQSLTIKSGGTKGSVSIKPTGSAEIVSVDLIDPAGKKVESVKTLNDLTSYTDFSKQGNYILNYTFRAKDDTAGSVVSSASTQGIAAVDGKASGTFSVTTKAPASTSVQNQIEPLTTVHVYDYSSSYAGKVKDSLRLSKKIIEANENPDSRHILQLYPDNYGQTSYDAWTKSKLKDTQGISSKLLTKQEALHIIDKLLAINAPTEKDPTFATYLDYFQGLADALGDKRYVDESQTQKVPFETIVTNLVKPTDTVSVIQYTDGWMDKGKPEEMDRSFAEWAKKRAKTFMSVINRNQVTDADTNSMRSIEQMKALGHPNIYDMTGKDKATVEADVVKQFLETATVKVTSTKGEDQPVTISITGSKSAKVTKATLKGPTNKELPIKDGSVAFSEKLPDGKWTVDYELAGDGDVTVTATVAGKEVVKDVKTLTAVRGVDGSSATKTDHLETLVRPKAVESKPITIEGLTVVAKDVRLGLIASNVKSVTVEKELHKATFKETVSPITFKREVVPVQAVVSVHDVYVKTLRPEAPKAKPVEAKTLPNTGTHASRAAEIAGVGLIGLSALTYKRRKNG